VVELPGSLQALVPRKVEELLRCGRVPDGVINGFRADLRESCSEALHERDEHLRYRVAQQFTDESRGKT
jgi:hypothetical protein